MTTGHDGDLLQRLADSIERARAGTPRRGGSAVGSGPVVTTDSADRRAPADDAADLYVGSTYLGSLYDLADLGAMLPEFEPGDDGEFDEAEFERRVASLLRRSSAGSQAWPWSTPDSDATPWAYRWAANSIQVYRLGRLFAVLYPTFRRARSRPVRSSPFPPMLTDSDDDA